MKFLTKYLLITFVIISSILVSSCEKEIEIDLKSVEPRLVIEALIENDLPARVKLSMTKDFYDENVFESLSNAAVIVSEENGISETLFFDESDKYFKSSNIIGKIGQKYNLSVLFDGKEYTATSTMPDIVPIDSVSLVFLNPMIKFPYPCVCFQDPPNVKNYYRHLIYINGQRVIKSDPANSDDFFDGNYMKLPITVNTKDGEDPFQTGDLITIEQHSIDRGAFLYFSTLNSVESSFNNPTSNIEGGALGYFSAQSIYTYSIIYTYW